MRRAAYRIEAEGRDITNLIADRLLSLSVMDVSGKKSDTMTLRLDNRDDKLKFPRTSATLKVWMGLEGGLVYKGLYSIDEISETIEGGELEIQGKAADMTGTIKGQKTRTWDGPLTLGKVVQVIAGENGYGFKVHPALAGIEIGHINQKAESDMNLLTRLCESHGGLMKCGAGMVLITPRGGGETATGVAIPMITINDPAESSGRITLQERGTYAAVQSCYFDEAQQKQINVVVSNGAQGPTLALKSREKNREAAQAAAQAKLAELARGKATMTLTRPLTPEIVSPGKVKVINHRSSCNGVWHVESAEHFIGSGQISYTALTLSTEAHDATEKS
ncbi:MAG: hypothetical protein ACRC8D_07155 [Aeromonas sp.]